MGEILTSWKVVGPEIMDETLYQTRESAQTAANAFALLNPGAVIYISEIRQQKWLSPAQQAISRLQEQISGLVTEVASLHSNLDFEREKRRNDLEDQKEFLVCLLGKMESNRDAFIEAFLVKTKLHAVIKDRIEGL